MDALQLVGAKPFGNPASMREAARVIAQEAQALEQRAARMQQRATGVRFRGPAAIAFRGRMAGIVGDVRGDARTLHAVASMLEREAGVLEARQRTWDRSFASAKQKVAELAKAAEARAAKVR